MTSDGYKMISCNEASLPQVNNASVNISYLSECAVSAMDVHIIDFP